MLLNELVGYTKNDCAGERPLLYFCSFVGRSLDEIEINDGQPSRQERPILLFAGVLNQVERLSSSGELISKVEICLDSPWASLNLQDHRVTFDGLSMINNIEEADFVTANRDEYEKYVRKKIEKWNGIKYKIAYKVIPYDLNLGLLPTYFSLLDKLERERLFIPYLA